MVKFYNYQPRIIIQKNADSVFLSDSLGRNVRYIYKTDVLYYPGCTIGALREKISTSEIRIQKYRYINILIGTNDLTPKFVWSSYKRQVRQGKTNIVLPTHIPKAHPVIEASYRLLIDSIQERNPTAKINIIAILPRPYDYEVNKKNTVAINDILERIALDNGCVFIRSFKSFTKCGIPKKEFYEDGLHVTAKGNRQLNKLIANVVNGDRKSIHT